MRLTFPARAGRAIAAALLLAACSDATGPHRDIDAARAEWLALNPAEYRFEIRVHSFGGTNGEYLRIHVVDGEAVEVLDANGEPSDYGWRPTIEQIWQVLLAARDQGDLNSALFSSQGVPVEVNRGQLANDSGSIYYVRNFVVIE